MTDDVLARLTVEIDAKLEDLRKDLDQTKAKATEATNSIARSTEASEKAFGRLGTAIKGVGLAVAAVAGAAAIRALSALPEAAANAERQFARLEGVIAATGGAAGRSVQQVEQLAQDIGRSTLASTQNVRDAAAQLLTFRNIAGETFDTTLRLAQDLAEAGFGSVESAALQLGKALNDPLTGLTALTRSGVTFTEQQREQVKALVETNDLLGAQAIIIEEVSNQVGGVAVEAARGYAGVVDTLGEEIKLTAEAFGRELLPAVTAAARGLTDFVIFIRQDVLPIFGAIGTAIGATSRFLGEFFNLTSRADAAINPLYTAQEQVATASAIAATRLDEAGAATERASRAASAAVPLVDQLRARYGDMAAAVAASTEALKLNDRALAASERARSAFNRATLDQVALSRVTTELLEAEARATEETGKRNSAANRTARLEVERLRLEKDALEVSFRSNIATGERFSQQQADISARVVEVANDVRDATRATEGLGAASRATAASAGVLIDAMAPPPIRGFTEAVSEAGAATAGFENDLADFDASPMTDALGDIGDAISSTFEDGLNTALGTLLGFENEFTRIISRMVARLAEQQFSINIGGTVGGNGSVSGGGGNDLLGQLQDLPVSDLLGQLFGSGGPAAGFAGAVPAPSFVSGGAAAFGPSLSGLSASTFGAGSGLSLGTVGAGIDGAFGVTGSAAANGLSLGSGTSSLFSGAAGGLFSAGAGILGSFIGSKLFDQNNPLLGSIGSGVGAIGGGLAGGALAGAAAGSIVPGIGTAIGALIGAILGSAAGMIGGPPSGEQQAALFSGTSGEFRSFSGRTGENFSQENQDAARSIGEAASALLVTLNAVTGTASAFRDVEGDVSNRDGALLRLSGNDDGLQTAAQLLEEDDIAATVVQAFLDATKDLKPEYDAIFRELLEPSDGLLRTIEGADLRDTAGDIDVERLERALDLIASINGATEALKDLGPTEFIGPVEAFYRSVKDEVARVRALNEEFGADISAVEELGAKAIAEFNAGFIQSLEDEVRALQGKPYLPAARQIIESTQRALDDAAQEGLTDALPLLSERFSLQFGQAIEDIDLSGLTEIRDFIMELEEPSDTSAQAIDILNTAIAGLSVVAEEVAEDLNRALLPAIQGTATGLEFVDGVWRQVQRNFDLRGDIAAGLSGGGNVIPLRDISEGLTPRIPAANTNAAPDLQLRQITDGFAQLFLTIRTGVDDVNAEILRSTDRTIAALSSAFEQQIAGLTALGAEFGRAAGQAGSIIASLATASTNPQTAFETLRGQFDSLAAGARGGSPGGVDAFASFQGDFLSAAREFFPEGTGEFFQQVEDVRAVALEAGANARARERDVASQIRALQSQQQAEADRLAELAERQIIENGARAEAQIAKLAELEQVLIRSAEQDRALLLAVIEVLNAERETTEVGNATLRDLRRLLSEANDRPIIVRVA